MSIKDWPGGYIKPVPPTPAGPYEDGAADGVWTLDQVAYWIKQGLWPTAGLKKYFIEDVFSTYIYTGNAASRTITNGIDLSGEGGLVWIKGRSATRVHRLTDTARGATKTLGTNSTAAESTDLNGLTAFNSNGFNLGTDSDFNAGSGATFVSWTFRKQAKFFDVITYTGNGTNGRTISHNLGSTPGCVIVKRTDTTGEWIVRHAAGGGINLLLNTTVAGDDPTTYANGNVSAFNSTTFTVSSGSTINAVNANGGTYVAYLFANNAGGFGDDGSQNVITCGSYTGNGDTTGPTVNLGWEPQWLLIKKSAGGTVGSGSSDWMLLDTMRGLAVDTGGSNPALYPNTSGAEDALGAGLFVFINATGFNPRGGSQLTNENGATYIYVAIRRGPMRTPTTGTSVYEAYYSTTSIANQTNGSLPSVDFTMQTQAPTPLGGYNWTVFDRLRGTNNYLLTDSTAAQATDTSVSFNAGQLGVRNSTWFSSGGVGYNIKRAPGFFDVVCYTGTGSATTVTHNLGVAPELMIVKRRDTSGTRWCVYSAATTSANILFLDTTDASIASSNWNSTNPTSSVFSVGTSAAVNASAGTYVAYLFATLSGVSKVGSYTGNGTNQTINCGFTTGARFVLIKRTDSTGNWVVFDYARGIVSGNDPYLTLNTTDAQVSDKDAVDTDSTGFVVNETTGPNINTNGASYLFLAIS